MGIEPLTASRHGSIRIGPRPDPLYGARHNHAVLGASEIMQASADYPLLLMKDGETGAFNIVALFGFAPGQNRFVINGRWQVTWVPGAMLRYPFYRDETAPHGLAIDEDCALLGSVGGEALFSGGEPSGFTLRIAETIAALIEDIAAAQALARTLAAHALVRPLMLVLTGADGHENQIDGLYGISQQALDELDDRAVVALHRAGALRAAHVMSASLNQMERVRQLHDHASQQPLARMVYAISE
jgi:hypothetical protein